MKEFVKVNFDKLFFYGRENYGKVLFFVFIELG